MTKGGNWENWVKKLTTEHSIWALLGKSILLILFCFFQTSCFTEPYVRDVWEVLFISFKISYSISLFLQLPQNRMLCQALPVANRCCFSWKMYEKSVLVKSGKTGAALPVDDRCVGFYSYRVELTRLLQFWVCKHSKNSQKNKRAKCGEDVGSVKGGGFTATAHRMNAAVVEHVRLVAAARCECRAVSRRCSALVRSTPQPSHLCRFSTCLRDTIVSKCSRPQQPDMQIC